MLRLSRRPVAFLSLMLAVCVVVPAAAQGRRRGGARPQSAKPDATAAAPQGADSLNNLKFRNLGHGGAPPPPPRWGQGWGPGGVWAGGASGGGGGGTPR